MNKAQVDAIRASYRAFYIELPDKQYQERAKAEDDYNAFANSCDHLYPDGTSAILTHMGNSCDICHRDKTGDTDRTPEIQY